MARLNWLLANQPQETVQLLRSSPKRLRDDLDRATLLAEAAVMRMGQGLSRAEAVDMALPMVCPADGPELMADNPPQASKGERAEVLAWANREMERQREAEIELPPEPSRERPTAR